MIESEALCRNRVREGIEVGDVTAHMQRKEPECTHEYNSTVVRGGGV